MYERYVELLKEKGVKNIDVSRATGIPASTFSDWKKGKSSPKREKLDKLAEFFGLRINGDSMSPRIMKGDTVIVRRQDDADSGDIVIVLINGDSATCKKLMKHQEGISLISFNPAYEPIKYSNKDIIEKPITIIGKVVENRQRY